jgi:hypothetical protein
VREARWRQGGVREARQRHQAGREHLGCWAALDGAGQRRTAAWREGGKAAKASGWGGSISGVAGSVDDEVSEERFRDEGCRVCRKSVKGRFAKCPPHHLIRDGGSIIIRRKNLFNVVH